MSWRDEIEIYPSALCLPKLSQQDYELLVTDIEKHGLLEPVRLWRNSEGATFLVDGRHRLDALERLGLPWADHVTYVDCPSDQLAAMVVGEHVSDEDLALGRAIRCLEDVGGADLTPWGLHKLSVVESHVARIRREIAQEAEVEHDVMVEANPA